MTILDQIIQSKKQQVQTARELYPVKLLEQSSYFTAPIVSLKNYLTRPGSSHIIAEIKRKSPSRGVINAHIDIEQLSIGYMQAGAAALSVLTDEQYFAGTNQDLTIARRFNFCPILRKDFIIDQYQIIEARSIGADAILLIAAVLSVSEATQLAKFAKSLGLEVLLEVHTLDEIKQYAALDVDLIGVNNRDLKDFSLSLQRSLELVSALPKQAVKISESGIESPADVIKLKQAGYQGFLIGDLFMRSADPAQSCARFVAGLAS